MNAKPYLLSLCLMAWLASPAMAADVKATPQKDFKPWEIRLRAIDVKPDTDGGTTIGGKPHADAAVVPEIDFSYYFTKNIAAELIVATSSHDLKLNGSALGDLDLGSTMILPPTLTVQYHFTPDSQLSPYVGAGVNYTLPYAEDNGSSINKLQIDGSWGWALQAGADYWLDEHWGLNVDVKKIFVDVDASVNSGAVHGNVDLDPWVIGTGIAYRF